jgi:outer membrane protein assembly factor BamD
MNFKVAFIFLLFIISSCSTYSKISKGDDYDAKFKLANEMYEKKKWTKCITLYEQVYQRLPKTGEGELSYFRLGKAHFSMGDYYMAGYHFGSFFDKYPYSTKTEESFFMKAICSVKNSPDYSMDQQDTQVALNDMQQFIYLFPKSSRIDTVNIIMDNLRAKLEKKDYENIKLYSKTLNYRSATVTAETFVNEYPRSNYKEEVYSIWLKNAYFLVQYSVIEKKKDRIEDFLETYRNFVAQFPQSKYFNELTSLNNSLEKELTILTNTK